MASRLTVIVSQSSSRDSQQADLEETLIAELMMAPGLDATLIGPLESIRADSTDLLCLKSFNHTVSLVSWLDAQSVAEHWSRLGLPGSLVFQRDQLDNGSSGQSSLRVHSFQIRIQDGHQAILEQLRQLQKDRAVRTVTISLDPPVQARPFLSVDAPSVESPRLPIDHPKSVVPADQQHETSAVSHAVDHEHVDSDEDQDWQQLDRLVDDLEAFDR